MTTDFKRDKNKIRKHDEFLELGIDLLYFQ